MKRLAMFVLVCVCLLVPRESRANDGGWWDWLWKWDAKFMGGNAEIHMLCLDKSGNRLAGCEQWFKNVYRAITFQPIEHNFDPALIKHQIDFRFGYYHNRGARYSPPLPEKRGSLNAAKLMAVYSYHVKPNVALTGGMGYLPVWGERLGLESRGVLSAGAVIRMPKYRWVTVRPELTLIPGGFTGADFGDPDVAYAKNNIVNFSIGIGIDLRGTGSVRKAP